MATEVTMPSSAATVPAAADPVEATVAQMNRAVSTPSRPTLTTPRMTMPTPEPATARSSRDWSSPLRLRAWEAIQKIIQVTRPTARMERPPPRISFAWKLRP